MPANPGDRTTVNLGAARIQAARQRAAEEGREFSEVLAAALDAYLEGPPRPPAELMPGLVPTAPSLREDMQILVAELRRLVPALTRSIEQHGEVMDTLDAITDELGKRRGAAAALEQATIATSRNR